MQILSPLETADHAISSSFSNMGKESRKKYLSGLHKNTKLLIEKDNDKILTVEEAAKSLALQMNGR